MVFYSWDGKVYVSLGESRKFRKLAETEEREESGASFIELSRKELKEHGSEQLFAKSKVCLESPLLKFYLGNFIVPDKEQRKHFFVCDLYSYVEITFTGLDSGVSGDTGKMVLQAPCLSEGMEFIGPFYFPLQAVLQAANEMEFTSAEKDILVQFYNMAPAMNDNWLLTVARFFNSSEDDNSYFVTFVPGEESPYFELQFKNEKTKACTQEVTNPPNEQPSKNP